MISHLLLVLGVAALSAALRSLQHPLLFRLGTLGILVTSFLAGWLLGGSVWLGAALAVSWLFLPWLEILTRIRRLRLPMDRTLAPCRPPNRHTFPNFSDLTEEVEGLGFEQLEDIGWEHGEQRHFYRVFNDPSRKLQASICLTEQSEFAFYYLTLVSRTRDGRVFMTWNYPFSYGLKWQPRLAINRFTGPHSFSAMVASHERLLRARGVTVKDVLEKTSEETVATMQNEMQTQIAHNIRVGLIRRDGENFIRYTVRGMFYLWLQFLRDLVRLS